MELPEDIRQKLDEVGDGADIRFLGKGPDGPRWAGGYVQKVLPSVKEAAQITLSEMKPEQRNSLQWNLVLNIIAGWKPSFGITGRMPDDRDVSRLRRSSWKWREHRRKMKAEALKAIDTREDEKATEIEKALEALADDETLYKWAVFDRHSVHMPKTLKKEAQDD